MKQQKQPRKRQRRSVSEKYIDPEGEEQIRASSTDIHTLFTRSVESLLNLPGFEQDQELGEWMVNAWAYYDAGEYAKAHQYLTWELKRLPALEPYVFYYMRVCERVLSISLERDEIFYEAKLERHRALPKLLKWIVPVKFLVRCKWCGRYTRYIDPNVPTYGFATSANSCMFCDRMYPMPSWMWDSPDGRAYSYYRMSFSDGEFYEEFERDYNPKPLCQHRRK